MLLIRVIPFALVSLVAACGGGPLQPPAGALIGTFGGPRTQLEASGGLVRVVATCSFAIYPGPVVPDAGGNFILPQGPVVGRDTTIQMEVRGRVAGDQIFATVTMTTRFGSSSERFTLTRDQPADVSGFACALAE